MYSEAYTPWDWHPKLQQIAVNLGLEFFSTPFDPTAVEFLQSLNVPAYKVASIKIVDLPLLRRIAQLKKPIILSTGMASLSEIDEAVTMLRESGAEAIALLKCTSAYPASPEDLNLRTIPHLARTFNVVSGLSDHTLGSSVAVAAVALGASIIEKHLILSRADEGPDARFSMEPVEFSDMVRSVRQVEQALGGISYIPTRAEGKTRCLRRSLSVVEDVKAEETVTESNVRSIRPGYGLAPRHLHDVLGKVAIRNIPRGTRFSWDLIAGEGGQ